MSPPLISTMEEPPMLSAAPPPSISPPLQQNAQNHSGTPTAQQQQTRLDMEGVFYRLHSRLVHQTNRWLSPTARSIVEMLILLNAFALLIMLCWLHVKYVSRAESNCVTDVLRRELGPHLGGSHPQVIKLQVSGIWSHLGREDAKSSEKLTKVIHAAPSDGTIVAANLFKVWLQDPVYVYSSERGFLMLDEITRQQFKMQDVSVRLRTETECFADSWMGETERYMLDNFIGYDTVILNAFGAIFNSKGYLYSVHSRELLNVAHVHSGGGGASSLAFKLGGVATTLFLFFITTTLVHHTLRETQERMLKFTADLQFYVRRGLGYRHLVLNHVIGSLVFVPIMVGVLFFLFEFFNDQLLAFMILAVVWVCELFSVMSLRTSENLSVFPKLFFLYFCSFHLYFFLFPSGFSYMALTCCVVFLQHSMLSFFFRYEMPALLSGRISTTKQRELMGGDVDTMQSQMMDPHSMGSLAVRALGGSRVNSFSSSINLMTNNQSLNAISTISTVTLNSASPSVPYPPNHQAPSQSVTTGGSAGAFFPRASTRRKRTTIHSEPQDIGNRTEVMSNGTASPPIVHVAPPPPLAVGPPRWPETSVGLFDNGGDDNSSQTSGWEIGGF